MNKKPKPQGNQALMRALNIIDEISQAPCDLNELAKKMNLTRSTTHRLASTLFLRGYLKFEPSSGYSLGPKLFQLGALVQQQWPLTAIAHPYLEKLAALTQNTVHLGILDEDTALYLDKIAGQRRFEISSKIGERHPICSTGLGKALIMDFDDKRWREIYSREYKGNLKAYSQWQKKMCTYKTQGVTFDLEENEDGVRCVAVPIHNAANQIIAAVSMSSAIQYLSMEDMPDYAIIVKRIANEISCELGWHS